MDDTFCVVSFCAAVWNYPGGGITGHRCTDAYHQPSGIACKTNQDCVNVKTESCVIPSGGGHSNCNPLCHFNVCGDGFIDKDGPDNIAKNADDEECDDGNTIDGDGCSATCKLESGNGSSPKSTSSQSSSLQCTKDTDCLRWGRPAVCLPCTGNLCPIGTCYDYMQICDTPTHTCTTKLVSCPCLTSKSSQPSQSSSQRSSVTGSSCQQGTDCTFETACYQSGGNCNGACGADFCCCTIQTNLCGNGRIDPGEQCESDASCTAGQECVSCSCRPIGDYCGDGEVTFPEQCDDGNTFSNDGCSSSCTIETNLCGNGRIDPGEQCEWSASCLPGQECVYCICRPQGNYCGDGQLTPPEQCDNGNQNSNTAPDACRRTCVNAFCGDGVRDSREGCDPGIDPGCPSNCGIVTPSSRSSIASSASSSRISATSPSSASSGGSQTSLSLPPPITTDGMHLACDRERCIPVPGEQADQCALAFGCGVSRHNICQGNMCVTVQAPGANVCSTSAGCGTATHTVCNEDQCLTITGQGGNECVVAKDCLLRLCGNGTLEPLAGEQCDDGNRRNGDGCSSICTKETAVAGVMTIANAQAQLTVPLPQGRCGDGTLNAGETCDDRNVVAGDGCSPTCQLEKTAPPPRCGDGIVTIGEGCDPPGRGCNAECRREVAEKCTSPDQCASGLCDQAGVCQLCTSDDACASGRCTPNGTCVPVTTMVSAVAGYSVCGDGVLSPPKECDDHNTKNGDGCSAQCFLEKGSCGDGIVQRALDEVCEPALMPWGTLPYRCDPVTCRYVSISCGDGHLDLGEACDAGAKNADLPDSVCRSDCSAPRCGDGIRDKAEACDDGNRLDGDGCPGDCGSATVVAGLAEAPGAILFPGQHGTPDALGRVLGTYNLDALTGKPYPAAPGTQGLPWRFPLASVQPVTTPRAPVGDTGPAAVAVIAAGAASGVAWMRRKRKEEKA
jgi:cysteine-rich repeat protein